MLGVRPLISPWVSGFNTETLASVNMVVVGLVIAALYGTVLGRQHSAPRVYQ